VLTLLLCLPQQCCQLEALLVLLLQMLLLSPSPPAALHAEDWQGC
jgi:hypothetical protein